MGFSNSIRLATLALALGAASCSVTADDVNINTGNGGPTAKDVAAKFPNITKVEYSNAAPALDEDFTVTLTQTGSATVKMPYLMSATEPAGVMLSSPSNDNVFSIEASLKAQLFKEGKYTTTFILESAPTADGFIARSTYMYDKTKSETNYVVGYGCPNAGGTASDLNKCFPELGLGIDAEKALQTELGSMISDIALPWVEVGPSTVDFSVSVTDVNPIDATHIAVYFSVTNHGTGDAIVTVGIFPGIVPTSNSYTASSEYLLSVAAGATVHEAKPVSLNWVSGTAYETGVWVDQPKFGNNPIRGEFFESNEDDNLGGFSWTAP